MECCADDLTSDCFLTRITRDTCLSVAVPMSSQPMNSVLSFAVKWIPTDSSFKLHVLLTLATQPHLSDSREVHKLQ